MLVLHDDHRERPRHPARQHDDRQPRRPLRPGAALPAARARRPLAASARTATWSCPSETRMTAGGASSGWRCCSASPSSAPASRSRSHDLEIRGARRAARRRKQSGSIAAVGFDTYAQHARGGGRRAARRADPQPSSIPRSPSTCPAFIPDDYVPDTGQRLELYRRLAQARDEDDVRATLGRDRATATARCPTRPCCWAR